MMDLHQIQVTYSAEEDRILCRASFKSEESGLQEVRAWLTRRLTRLLWPGIMNALETQVGLDKPQAFHVSADIVGMEHHACIEESRENGVFDAPYVTDIASFPLGETPLLVTSVDFSLNPNQPIRINMKPTQGYGFEIAFPQPILHSFCSLIREAAITAEWDIALEMPGSTMETASFRVLN